MAIHNAIIAVAVNLLRISRAIRVAKLPLGFFLFMLLAWSAPATDHPVRLGVNIAGSWHMFHTDKLFYQYESWFNAVGDLGIQFLDVNFLIKQANFPTTITRAQAYDQLLAIDSAVRAHNLQYTLSVELAQWKKSLELTPGVNEFDHPDGTHRWDLPMDFLTPLIASARPGAAGLIGINCDEGENNQLIGNEYVFGSDVNPPNSFDKPYYLVTDGMTLEAAYDGLVARADWLRAQHYQGAVRLVSEQVWPDLFPIFARAGWTIAPKLLKENFAAVEMAVALGAALQYAPQGADLWTNNDLFKWDLYPGWSPQALRSSLLMSYWLGASAIYVENLDFSESLKRNPLADPKGSLVAWSDPDHYTITNYGRVVQDFYKNYVPSHPRPFDWRDYRPTVAIIRLPDGCTGKPSDMGRDRMLGIRNRPVDDIAAEWLKVWSVLTHGTTLPGAISLAHWSTYPDPVSAPFFVPLDSVAVFDHTVQGTVLDSVRCFVVCGHALSQPTFDAVRTRVAGGATCIIARRLYNMYASGALPGDWLLVDDFNDSAVAGKLRPFLGPPEVARFRFKDYIVDFRPTADLDTLDVRVQSAANAADPAWLKVP